MVKKNPKIFIYSTDLDLCNSMSLLLQSKYQIRYSTTSIDCQDTDIDLLIIDMVIYDGKLLNKLKYIKTERPEIKILLLYIYRINETHLEDGYRKYSDLLLYKPVDVSQLMMAVENLIIKETNKLYSNRR